MSNINYLSILQDTVQRTMKDMGSVESNLQHAVIGVSGESGEFSDLYKKIAIYKSKNLYDHEVLNSLAYELGDLLWYIQLAAQTIGFDLETIIAMNHEKLSLRFPDKFTVQGTIDKADKQVTGELE